VQLLLVQVVAVYTTIAGVLVLLVGIFVTTTILL
jgi:hypothetical protein